MVAVVVAVAVAASEFVEVITWTKIQPFCTLRRPFDVKFHETKNELPPRDCRPPKSQAKTMCRIWDSKSEKKTMCRIWATKRQHKKQCVGKGVNTNRIQVQERG